MEEVVIVGAGIAGLAVAVALKRVGVRAMVLERSEELRATGAALSLFPNAWTALDALGVSDRLTPLYPAIEKGFVTDVKTKSTQQVRFGANEDYPRAVHRKVLLETLAKELPPNTIRFSSKLKTIETRAEEDSLISVLELEDGCIIKAKIVIGCDGVHSMVARLLGLSPPVDSGRSAVRGLAVYPQGHGLSLNEVQQYVDVSKRAGFVPLNDRELYWFFVYKNHPKGMLNMTGNPELIKKEVTENLAKDFPSPFLDVVGHSDILTLSWAPLMFRYPWGVVFGTLNKGNITIAGDAMHPMTPDLGQGGCLAIEDAVVLGRNIGNSIKSNRQLEPKDACQAIASYVEERRWRAAAIIAASYFSGWIQQDGSGWCMKFLRDVFYKLLLRKIVSLIQYDCGKLPNKME